MVLLFERTQFKGGVRPADEETAGLLTVRLLKGGLNGCNGFRIEQDGVAVVVESVAVKLLLEGDDSFRAPSMETMISTR